jgi:hypothetical protein
MNDGDKENKTLYNFVFELQYNVAYNQKRIFLRHIEIICITKMSL